MAVTTIPASLRANSAFKDDLKRFLSLSAEQWHGFRAVCGELSADVDDDVKAALLAVVPEKSRDEAGHMAHILKFAMTRATDEGIDLDALVADLQELSGVSLDADRAAALKAAITPLDIDIAEQRAASAFSFGNTYMNVYVQPILVPGRGESIRLYAGASVSVNARAPGGTKKVLSFHASAGELREIARKLNAGADKADGLISSHAKTGV